MFSILLLEIFLLLGLPAWAQAPNATNTTTGPPGALKIYTISANNITASFIPYGARLTSLLVPDRSGQMQDVVVGFDNPSEYVTDTINNATYLGPVVGRYANRIKNGTFQVDGVAYNISRNEVNDTQTLHGGAVGYDQQNWTVTSFTNNSITFSLLDVALEGFPGNVLTQATYSVNSSMQANGKPLTQLTAKLVSSALTAKTPIMLAHHIYWNLNVFKQPTVLNDTYLQLPLSNRYIQVDSNLIPTGQVPGVSSSPNGTLDFLKPKLIGQDLASAKVCGDNCTGYDTCFVIDRPTNISDWTSSPETMVLALNMTSETTGINMQLTTNQKAVQIYTCNGQNGKIPVKRSQVQRNGNGTQFVNKYGCVVIETEGWIDGINFPQWGQDPYQIFSPQTAPAVHWSNYVFGAM
ncbi:hypothetical protein AJ80_02564 [Polytolypa hystricis UAMH7299]|uniref:Aldose 1-epimerase n=1 Tax=Polytolypa hystricis (strain UAMH7299) TaxID=1447883 RepID=A0A2B7YR27_POLH7|nr:hypothetical protein AJ80_02564 [Polytolypa hystricis UAMH7299]